MTPSELHRHKMEQSINERRLKREAFITRLQNKTPFIYPISKHLNTSAYHIRNGNIDYGNPLTMSPELQDIYKSLTSKYDIHRVIQVLQAGYRRQKRVQFKQQLNEYFGLHYTY